MEKFDVVVIGAGPGGYPAAIRAAQLGASVAVIEKEAIGGTCLNWGCIPTKSLIAGAELYHRARHATAMGIDAGALTVDYARMVARKTGVVATLRGGVEMLLKGNGVKVLRGTGAFIARNRIGVTAAGGATETVEAGSTIIATGSDSVMPRFLPASPRVVDSRAFLELTALPESMIVMGGGVIGCEIACMAAQLGVKVTIVEMLEDVLMVLDADVRRELRRHMEQNLGIQILTGSPLADVKADEGGVTGRCGERDLKAGLLLVAVGRRPVTEGLNLAAVGIETTRGYIPVNAACGTRAATVFAIGDVTEGTTQLAHAATAQGIAAAENAVRRRQDRAERLVPACIFTSPEVGSVGLTEHEAKEKAIDVRVGKFNFAGLGKALATGEAAGFVKWVADAATDRLLGAHAVGPHATDLIAEAALAIRSELTVQEVGRTIHCHPTFAEAWMEAAHAAHGECIHAAPRRRHG